MNTQQNIWQRIGKWVARNIVLLVGLCLLFVFRGAIVELIIQYIVPFTSKVVPNNWWVLVVIGIAIVLCYVAGYNRLKKESGWRVTRYERYVLYFIGYLILRTSSRFEFYGIGNVPLCYMDYAWGLIVLIELFVLVRRRQRAKRELEETDAKPFIVDAPTAVDEMDRGQYANQLINKIGASINDSSTKGAFVILLNEHYGAGKTSFMLQLEGIAKEKRIDVCWLKPWLYDDTKTLIVNFMRMLQEVLGDEDRPLRKMLDRYGKVLSSIDGYKAFSYLSYDDASIETQFDEIKTKLISKRHPIIMMIDDVDRLQSDELMRMLQLVRNIADFPYIYYIIAGDKKALQNRLEENGVEEPDEYLKKFFNFEICFPADDKQLLNVMQKGVEEVMGRYGLLAQANEVLSFIYELRYHTAIFANIRDVKRFLNVFDFKLASLKDHGILGDVYLKDVAGVCMIQCIDSEFYQILRDHNEYVLEYREWHLKVKKDFQDVLADRSTKKMLYEAMISVPVDREKPKNPITEELNERVRTLADLADWSRPTKMEVMGVLMDKLFPQSHASESDVSVSHPTEYFKYFSTTYKGTEISNAEIIGLMQERNDVFQRELGRIIKQGKLGAFRHKLNWYMQTQEYNRVHAIEYIMDAFDIDWDATGEGAKSFKEISFLQNYSGSLFAVFRVRGKEEESFTHEKAWKEVSDWLIRSTNYEHRIWVLSTISKHVEYPTSYIFKSHENVMQCVEASEKQFIEEVWSKRKYDSQIYQLIQTYYGISPKIMDYVYEEICRMKNKSLFLYHLLKYEKGELQWNKELIETVFDTHQVFKDAGSRWIEILPEKWKDEFKSLSFHLTISQEDIKKSDFLKNALRYWKRVGKGTGENE